ncbi:MAG TPA: acyl carrier protein [Candidatus Angelobacter sp.]|jgi:acyl carrier protein
MEPKQDLEFARQAVAKISNKGLSPEEIRDEMDLKRDLGIDSLQFIRLILELERKSSRRIFNVRIIAQIKTFSDLCAAVIAT